MWPITDLALKSSTSHFCVTAGFQQMIAEKIEADGLQPGKRSARCHEFVMAGLPPMPVLPPPPPSPRLSFSNALLLLGVSRVDRLWNLPARGLDARQSGRRAGRQSGALAALYGNGRPYRSRAVLLGSSRVAWCFVWPQVRRPPL